MTSTGLDGARKDGEELKKWGLPMCRILTSGVPLSGGCPKMGNVPESEFIGQLITQPLTKK